MFDHHRRDEPFSFQHIPLKANKVLNVIFCILLLIGLRLWHLAVIQHDKKVEEAFHVRKRVWIEPAPRGTIRDRFNIVLAANRIEYRLAIVYSQFREIQSVLTQKLPDGTKRRRYVRREYIQRLSKVVADVIGADHKRLEDVIYSHGSQNNNIPLVIKNDLTEEQYYRLKLLEKDWQGIQVQCVPRRYYPRLRAACDVIGYLGPISQEKYSSTVSEIRSLSEYVKRKEQGQEVEPPAGVNSFVEAKMRLLTLNEQAYTINDSVGLLGIEASFENELRGLSGKRAYFSDAKGNQLRQLPGSMPAQPGKRVLLSLSIELQEFAEKLLAQAESDREQAFLHEAKSKKIKEPQVRGGAIVALDPKTGQVVTLASFPRYDPNDFIRTKNTFFSEGSQDEVLRWLENETYIAKVWDQMLPLYRQRLSEKSKQFIDVEEYLTWDHFLELILSQDSEIRQKLHSSLPIKKIIELQQVVGDNDLLVIDLSRLILSTEDFSPELVGLIGDLSIAEFRNLSSDYVQLSDEVRKNVRARWKELFYAPWLQGNEKEFLRQKRLEEKRLKLTARPYLDYLDKEEARQFEEFWRERRFDILKTYLEGEKLSSRYSALASCFADLPESEKRQFLACLRGFSSLKEPLYGTYPRLSVGKQDVTLQDLVTGLKRGFGEGGTRSFAYRHAAIQGSLFKLVTAYSGLKQCYSELQGHVSSKDFALFEIVDRTYKQNGKNYVGSFPSGAPIAQIYKGGRIPKSLYPDLGKVDLLRALEVSSNPYFSLLAGEYLKDPQQLYTAATEFGYGQKTDIRLPGETRGFVPSDIAQNRTGLYSMAIGQHMLLTTPLQSACMLAAIANGGNLNSPTICDLVVGAREIFGHDDKKNFPYEALLRLVGVDFPLFSKAALHVAKNEVVKIKPKEPRQIFMPKEIQNTLIEGLRRVIAHIHHDRSGALKRLASHRPDQYRAFMELKEQLVGKTSTAESQEKIGIDIGQPSTIYNHTWFGGISYNGKEPELIVVVYLRYGGYGREAAPIAAQMIKKWREISGETLTNANVREEALAKKS